MKNLKLFQTLGAVSCVTLLFSVQSCKKKTTDPTPAPVSTNGTVLLHLHTNVDTNEVDTYGKVYFMSGVRKVSVNLAQLYLSSIQLVKTDGTTFDLTGLNVLKVMEMEEYLLSTAVPSGNYRSIRFNVGLAPASDVVAPAANDSTLNKANMWFGSTASTGHIFLNFQGKIDTSAAATNSVSQMRPFSYRIGTNSNLKNVILPNQNYTILPNQAQYIHITIEYSKLFNNIQLNNASNLMVNTAADNAGPLAILLSNNIVSMFRYEIQ